MSYRAPLALAGTTPSPVPSVNNSDVNAFVVGSYVYMPPLAATVPWLDATLSVVNITEEQAALSVLDNVRNTLTALGNSVDDVRWVTGGYVYAKWRPNANAPAISYATQLRDALLQGALRISPQSQIIMRRFRVNMPMGRTDLYVYPTGSVPPPPAPPAGVAVQSSTGAQPSEQTAAAAATMQTVLVASGVAAGALLLGGVAFYFYRRRAVTSNRSKKNGRRRRAGRRS